MKHADFIQKLEEKYANNVAISRKKNADYADDGDAFKNFRAAEMLGISAEAGIIIRMSDKLVRASNLLNRDGQVVDEKITDTLADLANYAMILAVMIESKDDKK